VKEKTQFTLLALISLEPEDARIWVRDVACALDEINVEGREGELRRWLSGSTCPKAANLWRLGNAMRASGAPWCSGLWLLWACGRYAECMQILQQACHLQPRLTPRMLGALRMMFTAASALAERTVFERDLAAKGDFLTFPEYVRKESLDQETLKHVREFACASLGSGWENLYAGAPLAIAKDVDALIRREISKIPWAAYEALQADIDRAAQAFFDSASLSGRYRCENTIESAMSIVLDQSFTAEALPHALSLIGQYLLEVSWTNFGYGLEADADLDSLLHEDFSGMIRTLWSGSDALYDYLHEDVLERANAALTRVRTAGYTERDDIVL